MQSRIIFIFLFSFITFVGFGQKDQHHRTYESSQNDTIFNHMESTTTNGEVISIGFRQFETEKQTLVLATFDEKGNISWQKEIDFGRDTTTLVGLAKIDLNSVGDSILFTCSASINGDLTEIFGRCDKAGANCVVKSIQGGDTPTDFPNVAAFIDSTEILLKSGDRPTISRIGLDDDLLWSRTYDFIDNQGDTVQTQITDIVGTIDTTIVLADDGGTGSFFMAELDSNGVQLWAENYTFLEFAMIDPHPRQVIKLNNMSTAVVGQYGNGIADQKGFVMVVDTFGEPIFTKQVFIDGNTTDMKNILQTADGSIWMSGVYMENDSSYYFTTNMTTDGIVNWTTVYPGVVVGNEDITPDFTSLRPVDMSGAFLAGHAIDDAGLTMLNVMKHNTTGATPCSGIDTVTLVDIPVATDTLITEVENGGLFFNIIEVELKGTGILSPPELNVISDHLFCMNDFIDTILIAQVDNVSEITYQWGDLEEVPGAINDTFRIQLMPTEEKDYSVTVTISEDVCYQMCDTVKITRIPLPTVTISPDPTVECANGMVLFQNTLSAEGKPEYEYIWSTTETNEQISVSQSGTYSVTITDECGDMADATIEVLEPVFNPQISIEQINDTFCISNAVVLSAIYGGGGNGAVFEWKDNNGDVVVPFSSSEFNSRILALSEGDYTVSVLDDCGNMATNSIDVDFPEREDICANEFSFPKVFFPANSSEITELAFGPIPTSSTDPMFIDTMQVLDRITDIEFKVFNRWGEEVYTVESEDNSAFLMPWDGNHKGDPAPSEVYIYYFSYRLDKDINPEAPTLIKKGDITLVR